MTFAILLLLAIQPPTGRCLSYEVHPVVLTGTIKAHIFAGRPNYESIGRGDESERMWLIHLDKPICVEADEFSQKEKNVLKVQLVFEEGRTQYEKYHPLLGQRVVVNGELLHATTGHHYTRVLVRVKAIRKKRRTPAPV